MGQQQQPSQAQPAPGQPMRPLSEMPGNQVAIYPDQAAIADSDIAAGVDAFKSVFSRLGMAGVGRDVKACQKNAGKGAPADLVRQCFAFEMAAMIVTVGHDNQQHSAPMPNLAQADFMRRFDGYCDTLGVRRIDRKPVTDGLFQRVYPQINRI
jgi:hypothetical protein